MKTRPVSRWLRAMHGCVLLGVAGFLSTAAAQVPSSATLTKSEAPPAVLQPTINVPTSVAELASGYAAAVSQMSLKSLVIFIRSDGKTASIKGIRSARAMGGVLLIVFSAGDMMAVNAEHIVMITDGNRAP
jgi:glucosamine 6-phosphate synthetase-like amidotransferase/phosphosugar isomerase protein